MQRFGTLHVRNSHPCVGMYSEFVIHWGARPQRQRWKYEEGREIFSGFIVSRKSLCLPLCTGGREGRRECAVLVRLAMCRFAQEPSQPGASWQTGPVFKHQSRD